MNEDDKMAEVLDARGVPVEPMTEDEAIAFYEGHCASPGGVVLAYCYRANGEEGPMAIFSSLTLAKRWADAQQPDLSSAVFSPYIIDEPGYGQIPRQEMN